MNVIETSKHRLNNEPTARLVKSDNEHSVYRTRHGYILAFWPNCLDGTFPTVEAAEAEWERQKRQQVPTVLESMCAKYRTEIS